MTTNDPDKANVVNAARCGPTNRTFLTEGRWNKVLTQLKDCPLAGDLASATR
jgi:hypothetical protein